MTIVTTHVAVMHLAAGRLSLATTSQLHGVRNSIKNGCKGWPLVNLESSILYGNASDWKLTFHACTERVWERVEREVWLWGFSGKIRVTKARLTVHIDVVLTSGFHYRLLLLTPWNQAGRSGFDIDFRRLSVGSHSGSPPWPRVFPAWSLEPTFFYFFLPGALCPGWLPATHYSLSLTGPPHARDDLQIWTPARPSVDKKNARICRAHGSCTLALVSLF